MSSPTQRTLKHLRGQGFPLVEVVEHWNAFARVRHDLFGIIDVIAVSPTTGVTGVQCTSGDNVSARVKKIVDSDALHVLKLAGWRVLVHGWRKKANGRYELREVDLS